jgi:hypothetical protein
MPMVRLWSYGRIFRLVYSTMGTIGLAGGSLCGAYYFLS